MTIDPRLIEAITSKREGDGGLSAVMAPPTERKLSRDEHIAAALASGILASHPSPASPREAIDLYRKVYAELQSVREEDKQRGG